MEVAVLLSLVLVVMDVVSHADGRAAVTPDYVSSSCFDTDQQHLLLECPAGHMVKLNTVFFGYSSTGGCSYEGGNCTQNVPDLEHYGCVGHQTCEINLPTGKLGNRLPACDGVHGNYMQAHYNCVPASSVTNICGEQARLISQEGYIMSPRYPNNPPSQLSCSLDIIAPYKEQRIRLTIIDMQLETADVSGCADWLYMYDGFSAHTLCGPRQRHLVFTSKTRTLSLTFVTSEGQQRKGFWLHFQIVPFMTTTTSTTTELPATQTHTTIVFSGNGAKRTETFLKATYADPGASDKDYQKEQALHVAYQSDDAFHIGLVVGIILGAIILMLLVLLVVVVIRRDRRKRPVQSSSCSSAAAFLQPQPPGSTVHCITNNLGHQININKTKDVHPSSLDVQCLQKQGCRPASFLVDPEYENQRNQQVDIDFVKKRPYSALVYPVKPVDSRCIQLENTHSHNTQDAGKTLNCQADSKQNNSQHYQKNIQNILKSPGPSISTGGDHLSLALSPPSYNRALHLEPPPAAPYIDVNSRTGEEQLYC